MKQLAALFLSLLLLSASSLTFAQSAAPLSALARMPVKEVTVFKDGHAFVLHEGAMPTDAAGNVVMDYLPAPVLGTFWAYAADNRSKLNAVIAGQRRVLVERTALRLAEMLEANPGAEVLVTEKQMSTPYSATIIGIPRRTAQELEATSPPNSGDKLPIKADVILLRTSEGTKIVPLDRIQDVIFKNQMKPMVGDEEFRNLLTLKLDWTNRRAETTANIGLVYLQKGLRWIPSYRITLDANGTATVKLQAVLINELSDLQNATMNLVIGVPSFAFKETLDPMALQREAAQLSPYFQQSSDRTQMLSNAIMTQTARMTELRSRTDSQPSSDGTLEVTDATKNEDLYLFTVKNVSMKRGERLSLPIAEYTLKYKDIYTLELPFAPPAEARMNSNLNSEQQAEIARLLNAPKVTHKIRLINSSNAPLTTAPALIVKDDRVLAQGMMTYTATGASVDLELTKAIDIQVAKSENELSRTPNAVRWNGNWFTRVELSGSVKLTNYRKEASEIEVTRYILGNITAANNGGEVKKLNVTEEDKFVPSYPSWWYWYSFPSWWQQFNGIGRARWKLNLEAGKSIDLTYNWHYFWQ